MYVICKFRQSDPIKDILYIGSNTYSFLCMYEQLDLRDYMC